MKKKIKVTKIKLSTSVAVSKNIVYLVMNWKVTVPKTNANAALALMIGATIRTFFSVKNSVRKI